MTQIPVPMNMHINSIPQLTRSLGRKVWRAGQGGVREIIAPQCLGRLFSINHLNQMKFENGLTLSIMDQNVIPNNYNNWYVCASEFQAEMLTKHIHRHWTSEHEAKRLEYLADCDEAAKWTRENA